MNDILGVLMNLLIFLLILAKKFIESFFFFCPGRIVFHQEIQISWHQTILKAHNEYPFYYKF